MPPSPVSAEETKTRGPLQAMAQYFRDFGVLRETSLGYWGIQLVNILDSTAYFAILTISTLFLSGEIGLDDKSAGYVVAAYTSLVVILLTFSGAITDWLGIRSSLRLSLWLNLLLRGATGAAALIPGLPHRAWIVAILLILQAFPAASIQTVFQASCQRFTTRKSRSAGFNLWYLFMNIGAALGGVSIDVIRLGLQLSNAHLFTMSVGLAIVCIVISETMVRDERQVRGEGEPEEALEATKKPGPLLAMRLAFGHPAFFRLLGLACMILGVRAVYAYLYLLMPKYWERTIGADAQIGLLNTINPVGIVIGLVLFIPLANRLSVFAMLIYGAAISALSLFPMALPYGWYSADLARAHYMMAIACMVVLTIGEVMWSPKFYEYTAAVAPKGQEGIYLGFAMIPWFVAKSAVSALSGHFLGRWCPETVQIEGETLTLRTAIETGRLSYWDSPAAMWLILGVYALAGCVLAMALRPWFTRDLRS